MASVTGALGTHDAAMPSQPRAAERILSKMATIRWWRFVVLGAAAIYFFFPLAAGLRFALDRESGSGLTFANFKGIFTVETGFSASLWLSIRLALVATVIVLALVIPTAIYIHLRVPWLKRTMDAVTVLPVVIPPVVLIIGVLQVAPGWLKATPYLLALEYAVLAMPFVYRAMDAGLRSIDAQTLVDASRSLGGGWATTLFRVLVPNLRTAILSGSVLTIALVIGEFTMASLDEYQTFTVWIYGTNQDNAWISEAASMLALIITCALLFGIVLIDWAWGRRIGRGRGTLSAAVGGA
jgi:putative spermidine/putrescine transport system permease protein